MTPPIRVLSSAFELSHLPNRAELRLRDLDRVIELVKSHAPDIVALQEADQRDPSGRTAQSYIVSDSGRVYLFLGHACGQLA